MLMQAKARLFLSRHQPADPACLVIDLNTPDGQATGLVRDSVVSCRLLVTVYVDTVAQILGTLSPAMRQKLDECLKAGLGLA